MRLIASCKSRVDTAHFLRGRMISAHIAHFFTIHFYLLLFTLSEAKQTPQSRLCRAGSPTGGAEKQANEVRPYGRNNKICEDFVPLTRQRCVESPHPTSCVSINLYRLHGRRYPPISRTFSLFTFTYYFERSETPSTGEPK